MAEGEPDPDADRGQARADPQAAARDAAGPARSVRQERAEEVHDRGGAGRPACSGFVRYRCGGGGALMGYTAALKVWRGDAGSGSLVDYKVDVNEGEVVLDVLNKPETTE